MSKISFIHSDDPKYNIERCLSLIKSEIMSGLKNAKRVVVKVNCITDNSRLASTNVDTLDALLNFIKPYTNCQINLVEGSSIGNTMTAFRNYHYFDLQEKYDFTVTDLNDDEYDFIELIDKNGKPWQAQISKTILNSDYLISLSSIKTHNQLIYDGAISNIATGLVLRQEKRIPGLITDKLGFTKNNKTYIYQDPKASSENIKRLYKAAPVKLAILDAHEAMQGDGPIKGEMVPAHFAIASSDPIAADWLSCQMIGIDADDIGYLSILEKEEENKSDYFVIGDNWKNHILNFKMPPDFEKIRKWK